MSAGAPGPGAPESPPEAGPVGPFEFATATRILFGAGRAAELPAIVAGLGTRALVCTGSAPGRHAALIESLPVPRALVPVVGEPTVVTAREAADAGREHRADVVVAIGGGSVIDLAKAVGALLGNGGDPMDYLEVVGRGEKIQRPSPPVVAVPTTAGTGAEVTANAVLASPPHRLKASLRSPLMLPRVALVDPLLTLDAPRSVTASSGLDALTQCLEPFVSPWANPLTDALAGEGLSRAAGGLRRAYADGSDVAARTDMALCGLLGGLALANAKLGAVHGLAGVIGGMVAVPHGVACAALLAPVVAANLRALADAGDADALDRYRRVAVLLTGEPAATPEDGIAWIRETVARLDVPRLGAFGLDPAEHGQIAAKAARSSSMRGNPVPLGEPELVAILAEAG